MNKKITIDVPAELIPVINNIITVYCNNCSVCSDSTVNNTVIDSTDNTDNKDSNIIKQCYEQDRQDSNTEHNIYTDFYTPNVEDVVNYVKKRNMLDKFDAVMWFDYWNDRNWLDNNNEKIRKWTRMLDFAFSNSPRFLGKTVYPKEEEHIPLPKTVRANKQTSIRRLT